MSDRALIFDIIEGTDLIDMDPSGTSDPYVVISCKGKAVFKTKVIYKTLNPQWNERFVYRLSDAIPDSEFAEIPEVFELKLFDKDMGFTDDRMGKVTIAIADVLLSPGCVIDRWFKIESVKAKDRVRGEIHVRVQLNGPSPSQASLQSLRRSSISTLSRDNRDNEATSAIGIDRIHMYARQGDLNSIEQLMFGKDGKTRASLIECWDESRKTPLHLAAEEGHRQVVEFFVRRGANLNALDAYQWTPLHAAARRGQMDVTFSLIKHGADVAILNSTSNLALHYVLRYCSEKRIPFLLAVVTLLAPSLDEMQSVNDRGETLLHCAALNSDSNIVFFLIMFLLANNVDSTVTSENGRLCWHYLNPECAKWLSNRLNLPEILAAVQSSSSSGQPERPAIGPDILGPPPIRVPPAPPSKSATIPLKDAWNLDIEFKQTAENEIAEMLLPKLTQAQEELVDLQPKTDRDVQLLVRATAALREAIGSLAPRETDHILASMALSKFGDRFVRRILAQDLHIRLSDAVARTEQLKGRAIVITPLEQKHRIYFELYNDALVVASAERVHNQIHNHQQQQQQREQENHGITPNRVSEDFPHPLLSRSSSLYVGAVEHANDATPTAMQHVFLFPIKRCSVFRIPDGFGIEHSFQLVYAPSGQPPLSFTICLLSETERIRFLDLFNSLNTEARASFISAPSKDFFIQPQDVLAQGYLAKKGQLVFRWQRYYVRVTRNMLCYFNTDTDLRPRGIVLIDGHKLTFDDSQFMIKWTHPSQKVSYQFCALTPTDFDHWKEMLAPLV